MTDWTHLDTGRLDLRAVTEADVDELYDLSSDPRVWRHLPSGRHTDRQQTADQVARFVDSWQRHGLGYWTARRDDQFVGVGGCAVKEPAGWNIYYRLRPEAQGHGYATEIARAAIRAAADVRPDLPVFAYLLEHNHASRAVAERLGLTLAWSGPDADDPASTRLIFADRPLAADALDALTALP